MATTICLSATIQRRLAINGSFVLYSEHALEGTVAVRSSRRTDGAERSLTNRLACLGLWSRLKSAL